MTALASDLGFDTMDKFYNYIDFSNGDVSQVGRPRASIGPRQVAYDYWKEISELSTDRGNARHLKKNR